MTNLLNKYSDQEIEEMIHQSQTDKAKELYLQGKLLKALRIVKTFRNDITAEEKRAVEITFECMTGKEAFYKSINVDLDAVKQLADEACKKILKIENK